jgi:hypothetical protein
MRMRLEVMCNKIARCENEILDNEERHEQELKQEKALTAIKDQDLLRQRKKIRELQSTIREYWEMLLGAQPASKKIKVEDQGLIKAVAVEDRHLPVKARAITDPSDKRTMTAAYAESSHHQRNLAIVLKKDSSIKSPKNQELSGAVHGNENVNRTATREDIIRALDLWKNHLIKSDEYKPFQQRSEDRNIERIMLTLGRYYPRNTVIPVVIPKKELFFPTGLLTMLR